MRRFLPILAVLGGFLTICYANSPLLSDTEVARLRLRGPAGLDELLTAHADEIARGPRNDPSWHRLAAAIDAVAAQKDAYVLKLFWYTNLDEAMAAARREGKPILSLRLLGKLDCDLSCANSRFFRTTLYPDPAVSNLLREKFILHWKSERPVPVVTIDFGDGRSMKRTITGNSVHYVLRPDGRPIDAIPGLYSAPAFIKCLNESLAMQNDTDPQLRDHHAAAATRLESAPKQIAPAPLSNEAVKLVLAKSPPRAEDANLRSASKAFVETPQLKMVRNLQNTIAQDTLQNEYNFHKRIHQWFAAGEVRDMESLNTRVYAELFLTPRSDPWLGLAPPDAFSALENEGLSATASR